MVYMRSFLFFAFYLQEHNISKCFSSTYYLFYFFKNRLFEKQNQIKLFKKINLINV